MKHKIEVMQTRSDYIKVIFGGRFNIKIIEDAIFMIEGYNRLHRPFMNPYNQIVEFMIPKCLTKELALEDMIDNIRCLETYAPFINSIDFEPEV